MDIEKKLINPDTLIDISSPAKKEEALELITIPELNLSLPRDFLKCIGYLRGLFGLSEDSNLPTSALLKSMSANLPSVREGGIELLSPILQKLQTIKNESFLRSITRSLDVFAT